MTPVQRKQRPPFKTESRIFLAVWIEYLLYLVAGEGTWLHRCCLSGDSPPHGQFCFLGLLFFLQAVFSPQVFLRWLGGGLACYYFWFAAQSFRQTRRNHSRGDRRPGGAA